MSNGPNWGARLNKFLGRSEAAHAFFRKRTSVYRLDPDLAVNRSMALHMKMTLQRNRNYAKSLENDVGWFRGKIAGWFDDE